MRVIWPPPDLIFALHPESPPLGKDIRSREIPTRPEHRTETQAWSILSSRVRQIEGGSVPGFVADSLQLGQIAAERAQGGRLYIFLIALLRVLSLALGRCEVRVQFF